MCSFSDIVFLSEGNL